MSIQNLQDLPNLYKSEWSKFDELVKTYPITTTGAQSFTSVSSATTYTTTNGGWLNIFTQLQTVLQPYLVNSTYWNSIQTEITNNITSLKTIYTTAGTSPTYTVTVPAGAMFSYTAGQSLKIKFHATSSVASTLNVNSLGAKAIKKPNGNDFTNIYASVYTLIYDGTNFILQGEGASGNAVASNLLLGKTATTDVGEITGTMPNRSASNTSAVSYNGTVTYQRLYMQPQLGYFNGVDAKTYVDEPNYIQSNIVLGKSLFGLTGTQAPLFYSTTSSALTVTLSAATGTYYSSSFNITGLSFTPQQIYGTCMGNAGTAYVGGMVAYGTYLTANPSSIGLTVSFDSVVFSSGSVTGRFKVVSGVTSAGSVATTLQFILS